MKSWLEKNVIQMYSTHNEGKFDIAERFIKTLKNKMISKNMYIDKLDDIINKYNNPYQRTIKMKPVDVKPSTYIDSSKEIFLQGYVPNWSEEVSVITKIKNTVSWTYVISDLKDKDIVGTFYAKELQKTYQKKF